MRFLEYEAKEVLKQAGIAVPRGIVARSPEEAVAAFAELGSRAIVKPMGLKKRGKAGLISRAASAQEVNEFAKGTLGKSVGETKIDELLVEQLVDIEREYYVAITIDSSLAKPVIVVSSEGGVDIEETAKEKPNAVKRLAVDIRKGIDMQALLAMLAGIDNERAVRLSAIVESLYGVFRKYDAETVEVNPLALTKSNDFFALDAFIQMNEDSVFRHEELKEKALARKYRTVLERTLGEEEGWSYIDMDGDIAVISSGAGLSMATMDLLAQQGGKPADFFDMAQVDGDGLFKAFSIVSKKEGIKVIFVNLFAGLNRCDAMADGIKRYVQANQVKVPIVARLVGNMEDEGTQLLKDAGIENTKSLEAAVQKAVEVSKQR